MTARSPWRETHFTLQLRRPAFWHLRSSALLVEQIRADAEHPGEVDLSFR